MSIMFQHEGQEIWNPATAVANLFMSQVAGLEALAQAPSGLTPGDSDEIDVDVAALERFLVALHKRLSNTNNRAMHALCAAPTSILTALYARCESDVSKWPPMLAGQPESGLALIR